MAEYAEKIMKKLKEFRDKDEHCDIEIVVNGQKFKAHRNVLCASSSYFRDLLGRSENDQKPLMLYALGPSVFKTVLDFIYSGHLNMDEIDIRDLFLAGDMLKMPEMVAKCKDKLCTDMNVENVINKLNLAETNDFEELIEAGIHFVCKNFTLMSQKDAISEISKSNLIFILTSETRYRPNESDLLRAVFRWLAHDINDRAKYVHELYCFIEFHLVESGVFSQLISECIHPPLKEPLLLMQKKFSIDKHETTESKYIYIIDNRGHIFQYNLLLNIWTELSTLPNIAFVLAITSLAGKLYGGIYTRNVARVLFTCAMTVYNPECDSWNLIKSMAIPRHQFGLCAFSGKLWAFGGCDQTDSVLSNIECYDPRTDVWTLTDAMPEPRYGMKMFCFDGLFFMLGGKNNRHVPFYDFQSFNPATYCWSMLPKIPTERHGFGASIVGRNLYVVGGMDTDKAVLDTVERYCFDTNIWETVTPLTEKCCNVAAVEANGLLYVFVGGEKNKCFDRFVNCFDPTTNIWTKCSNLPNQIIASHIWAVNI